MSNNNNNNRSLPTNSVVYNEDIGSPTSSMELDVDGNPSSPAASGSEMENNTYLQERIINASQRDVGGNPEKRFKNFASHFSTCMRHHYNENHQYSRDDLSISGASILAYNQTNLNNTRLEVFINPTDKTMLFVGFVSDNHGGEFSVFTQKTLGYHPEFNALNQISDTSAYISILGNKVMTERDNIDYMNALLQDVTIPDNCTLQRSAGEAPLPEDPTLAPLSDNEWALEVEMNSPYSYTSEEPSPQSEDENREEDLAFPPNTEEVDRDLITNPAPSYIPPAPGYNPGGNPPNYNPGANPPNYNSVVPSSSNMDNSAPSSSNVNDPVAPSLSNINNSSVSGINNTQEDSDYNMEQQEVRGQEDPIVPSVGFSDRLNSIGSSNKRKIEEIDEEPMPESSKRTKLSEGTDDYLEASVNELFLNRTQESSENIRENSQISSTNKRRSEYDKDDPDGNSGSAGFGGPPTDLGGGASPSSNLKVTLYVVFNNLVLVITEFIDILLDVVMNI